MSASITLRKQPANSVATPDTAHVTYFVDVDGLPKLKDSAGSVTDAAQAGQVTLTEVGVSPVPPSDAGVLYTKDVGGVTELFYRGSPAPEVQITTNGSLVQPGLTLFPNPAGEFEEIFQIDSGILGEQRNTGIVFTPTDDTTVLLEITREESTGVGVILNKELFIFTFSGTLPTIPGTLMTFITGSGADIFGGGTPVLDYADIGLNASSELVITYDNNSLNDVSIRHRIGLNAPRPIPDVP